MTFDERTFDERISIKTPEGLEIELNLAGLGSRIAAAVVDGVALAVMLVLAAFGMFGLADRMASPLLALGIGWLIVLLITIGYFVAFEVFNDGRTPGKSMFSIQVVGIDGEPVGFGPSVVRNLLRLVDLFPALPVLGAISILASDRNQRLGDLAARTIVIRNTKTGADEPSLTRPDPETAAWDVSGVDDHDLELARRFLARRADLTDEKRTELAGDIAGRLRRKVPGAGQEASDEWLVEQVVAVKVARQNG
jgi:uncharacterized RDD family membrane protein YckC